MRTWLAARTDFPLVGRFFTEEWMVCVMTYGGLGIDLVVVPLLLFRRTRAAGMILAVLFHLMNARLFTIVVPLRHFLYPGNVHWTEEGHKFAWHMKLRTKSGKIVFTAEDSATGEAWIVEHRAFLTGRQIRNPRGPGSCPSRSR